MTRRVIKPQPKPYLGYMTDYENTGAIQCGVDYPDTDKDFVKCPYGQVGDTLIIKETWASEKRYDHLKPSEIPNTAKIYYVDKLIYSAGGYSLFTEMGKIRSAMFMCLWMSRARPEITAVRVERVREISIADALAEGMKGPFTAISQFENLWDSLNAKRGYGWEVNPGVWVIEFGATGVRVK